MGSECDGAHNKMRPASLTVTPLSPLCLLGDALISIHTKFCVSAMGTLEGEGMPAQITDSK